MKDQNLEGHGRTRGEVEVQVVNERRERLTRVRCLFIPGHDLVHLDQRRSPGSMNKE